MCHSRGISTSQKSSLSSTKDTMERHHRKAKTAANAGISLSVKRQDLRTKYVTHQDILPVANNNLPKLESNRPPLSKSTKMVSPLSEECNRFVFEAVNENSLSKLKLAKTTYNPILLMESLVQCNEQGKTPIIVAMERGNASVIKKLVTWMSKNTTNFLKNEEWKPMFIIIIDQLIHHIPVIELISHLIQPSANLVNRFDKCTSREGLVELIGLLFLQSTSLSRQDKINAQELIGALVIIHYCESKSRFTLKCWKEAMTLRYFPQDDEPLLPKVPAIYVPTRASSIISGSVAEIMTMEELKLLEEDFECKSSFEPFLFKKILIQALLVMRRIFTQANLGHSHVLYLESFLEFANIMSGYETELEFSMRTMSKNISINTYLFILEQLNGFDPKLFSHRLIVSALHFMTFRLKDLIDEKIRKEESESDYLAEEESESYYSAQEEPAEPDNLAIEKFLFDYLLALTKFIVTVSEFFPNPAMISSYKFMGGNDFADMFSSCLEILKYISPQITEQEKQQIEEYFSYFIRDLYPERTNTVLRRAVMEAYYLTFNGSNIRWKILELKKITTRIKLILQLGADVNAIDEEGKTALHLLLLDPMPPMQGNHWKEYMKIFQTLVDAGSHLYLADDNGKTVMSILRGIVKQNENDEELPNQHYFESLVIDVFPLTCLCARVIRRHRIPFQRLPPVLQKLVSL